MSLNVAYTNLTGATKALAQEWRQLDTCWRDERYLDFQCRYMDRLATVVEEALRTISEMDERVTKIRHDCE